MLYLRSRLGERDRPLPTTTGESGLGVASQNWGSRCSLIFEIHPILII